MDEKVYLDLEVARVTASKIVIQDSTWFLNQITGIEKKSRHAVTQVADGRPVRRSAWLLMLAGIVITAGSFLSMNNSNRVDLNLQHASPEKLVFALIGVVFTIMGMSGTHRPPRPLSYVEYYVIIRDSSGAREAIQSEDPDVIDQVVGAISEAIERK